MDTSGSQQPSGGGAQPMDTSTGNQQQQQAQPPAADPAVVDMIIAMGLTGDRTYVAQIVSKAGNNAEL